MGAVYRAVDESLGVDVALKENLFTTEDYARQFRMEAIILAAIRHPNLPRVTDHFVIDELGQYLVMDYIDGYDLRQYLEKDGPISEAEAVRIGAAACDALSYLHSRKPPILHRDIKLGNIKIANDGQIYLVDFGLAKMGWEHEETMTGARAMTPGYSPPEQYGSARTDARTDVYSLGATLYAALTGIIPEDSLIRAVDGVSLTPLREHRPEVSPRLAAVIEKALEINSVNRYQSAKVFKQALLGESEPLSENPKPQTLPRSAHRKPGDESSSSSISFWRLSGFFIIMLIIVVGTIWFTPLNQNLFQLGLSPQPTSIITQTPMATRRILATASHTPLNSLLLNSRTVASPSSTRTAVHTPTRTPTRTPTATIPITATFEPSVTPTIVPAQATGQGGGLSEIAFASKDGKVSQIFSIKADGTDLKRLTSLPAGACSPDWSPDGRQLIFVSPCIEKASQYPDSGLFILDLETGEVMALPFDPAGDFEPAWSPDGQKIAFTSLRDGTLQVYVFNFSDSSLTNLTSGSATQSRYPAWSPDSSRIVYTVLRIGLLQIWSMFADGSQKQQLVRTGGTFSEYLPSWSPDGTFLLFSQTNDIITVPSALIRFDLQTGNSSQLPIPRPVVDVDFSPDGQWIAYETTDTKNPDIYICQLLECVPQRLTTASANDFDPVWRPEK